MDDQSMREREAFLRAIKEDFLDAVNRKVYADWLDEHDEPEEADFFRSWTLEKYVRAEAYLKEYARKLCEDSVYGKYRVEGEEPEPGDLVSALTCEQLLAAAHEYLDTGENFYLNFDIPDYIYNEEEQFWESFQTVTGRRIPEERAKQLNHIFRCSC